MAGLRDKDRDAIVLRYFQNRSLRDMGAALRVDEYAAQKRVARALEKLRVFFVKRGIDSTAATIAETISVNSIQAAPALLGKSVTAVVMAKGAAASGSTLILVKGALKLMAWTKAKTAILVGAEGFWLRAWGRCWWRRRLVSLIFKAQGKALWNTARKRSVWFSRSSRTMGSSRDG